MIESKETTLCVCVCRLFGDSMVVHLFFCEDVFYVLIRGVGLTEEERRLSE